MTVDLESMMDMRDVQVALDVAKRAELGWFDVEFTMYGCAYWEGGKRFYRVSAFDEKIYDFIEGGAKKDVFPTDICVLSRKYPVPTGMREYIALDVKKELAMEMAEQFPPGFFTLLEQLAREAVEDRALPWLLGQKEQVAGCFDLQKMRRFQEMVDHAYTCRKLRQESYADLRAWIAEERKSMEENSMAKDIFEKTFYAIAYQDESGLKHIINARRGYIYQKKHALEQQGIFVSPIYAETYYYNYTLRLPQIRQMFEAEARAYLDQAYLSDLQSIFRHNDQLSEKDFADHLQNTLEQYGPKAQQTLRHYGHRWGILGQ